ncbi:MAG: transporter, family, methylenomycin resistance protein [Microbacteriaceae bacterium]|nr:transporter, family, methylenomycin resistance protein [Microbacteriaceae bacterium]
MTTARPAREPSPRAGTALPIGSLGFFLITLDILIVNVALARIGQDLGGGTAGKQWVIDGYTLMFASLLLSAGNLSDRIGAKRAIAIGITLFAVSSAACSPRASARSSVLASRRGRRPRSCCRPRWR